MEHKVAVARVDITKRGLFHGIKKGRTMRPLRLGSGSVFGVDDGFVHSIPTGSVDTPVIGGVLVTVDANLSSLHFFVGIDTHNAYVFIVYIPGYQFVISTSPKTNVLQRY
jgi:hypothetical protein